ncbi:hypothetical protein DEO72_LG6g1536 [Vigna unguiculata]|uniref:Uncharacterized protein n=1 Tax=Vigna unguiculata TaxID=3917 RepID=A0A4D6M9P4_VIGUN|nr:hypothetical protein DEO72_LG6g1536 [Vigna unguiculata]
MSFCSFVSSSLNCSRSCCLSLCTPKNLAVGPSPGERRSPKRACVGVRGWVFAVAAQARGPTFGRGAGSLRRGRTRLSEYARNTRSPLSRSRLTEGLSLKREDPSHLSEGLWPKRGLGERMCGYCLESLFELGGEQLGGEQRYPPRVQASAKSDQVIYARNTRDQQGGDGFAA